MKRLVVLAGLFAWLVSESPALACKFCPSPPLTLREEAAQAQMVLYGTVANPRQGRDGSGNALDDPKGGTTDFFIEQVIKADPALGGKKRLELPRYVPVDPKKNRYLIFLDVDKGRLDPYRGVIASPAIVDYLRGMTALDPKNQRQVLAYAFRHLEHADAEIAQDAVNEFLRANYKDYRDLARTLRPDLLARWLQDPKVPAHRRGLYALLLGHCGTDADTQPLRASLDDSVKNQNPYTDQALIGYTLLRRQEGWKYATETLKDPSGEFLLRYAALRAVRFFWDERPEFLPRNDLFAAFCQALEHPDMADLAIEDLRRRGQWDATARILALRRQEPYWKVPILRRTVVRYALTCPQPEAARFVQEMRQEYRQLVEEQEELLRLEKGDNPSPRAASS